MDHHVNHECVLRAVRCPNNCGQKLVFKTLAAHLHKTCPLRHVECPLGCGVATSLSQQARHVAEECPKRVARCICGAEIAAGDRAQHELTDCLYTWTRCSLGCGAPVQVYQLQDHVDNHCPKRHASCSLACGIVLWAEEMAMHYTHDCMHREVPCRLGCGKRGILAKELDDHERAECLLREVPCPVGCGTNVSFTHMQDHLQFHCPLAKVSCPLGCGARVLRADLDVHEAETCPRRQILCPAGCLMWVTHDRLDAHMRETCDLGVIKCPLGCGNWLRRGNLKEHQQVCSCRIVPCGGGFEGCARQVRSWLIPSSPSKHGLQQQHGHPGPHHRHDDDNSDHHHHHHHHQARTGAASSPLRMLVYCEPHLETALTFAAKAGDQALVLSILDQLDPSRKDQGVDFVTLNGSTALIYACRGGHVKCAEALLEHGASVDLETSHGATALLEAIRAGAGDVCKVLIARRADVFSANSQRLTPLIVAQRSKRADVVSLIYAHTRLHTQQRELFGHVALGNFAAVQQMLQNGAPHELNIVEKLQLKLERLRVEKDEVAAGIEEMEHAVHEAEAHYRAFTDDIREKEKAAKALQRRVAQMEGHKKQLSVEIVPYFKRQLRALQEVRDIHVAEVQRIYEPPGFMRRTFTALLLLMGHRPHQVKDRRDMGRSMVEDWWGPARECLSKHDFVRTVQLFNFSETPDEVIARVRAEFVSPDGAAIPAPNEEEEAKEEEKGNSSGGDAVEDSLSREDATFLRGDGNVSGDKSGRAALSGVRLPAQPPPLPKALANAATNRANAPGGGVGSHKEEAAAGAAPLVVDSDNDSGSADGRVKRRHDARDDKWGYRSGADGYPLIEALQRYISYVCQHRDFELQRRSMDVEAARLKAEQNQIMASLWPDHAAYKRAEFKHVMLSERYEELTKRQRAINFAADRASQRFDVSLLLNSRTATGHTALSWAAQYNDSSIIQLLCKYGSALDYEDCVGAAAAAVLQTLFRHYSWKLHREPWTPQRGQRYRLQESTTWRRIRSLYQRFEFLRETGRVPLIDAFYNGSLNSVETLLSRKANPYCTSYAYLARPVSMNIPRRIRASRTPLVAWYDPKTQPASRSKIEAMRAATQVLTAELRELRVAHRVLRRTQRTTRATARAAVMVAAEAFASHKAAATTARTALEAHREAMFELVLDRAAQQRMEEDLAAREDAVGALEGTARGAKDWLKAAKRAHQALAAEQHHREEASAAAVEKKERELRRHSASLARRIEQLEPYTILTAAQTAAKTRGALGFVRGEGWVPRGRYEQALQRAQELWDKAQVEREQRRIKLLGLKEVLRRGKLQAQLNAHLGDAILANDYDLVTRCLDQGAHADHEPAHGYTALIMAAERDVLCHNKDGEVVHAVCMLLDREERQAQVGRESRKLGYTALTRAAHKGKVHALEQLLRRGANPNYVTRFGPTAGTTALIVAARNGKADAVRLLLEWGADAALAEKEKEGAAGGGEGAVTAVAAARRKNFTSACRELCFHAARHAGSIQAAFRVAVAQNFCQWGCGHLLAADEVEDHEREDCPKATVTCPNGCGKRGIWRSSLTDHLDTHCGRREVKCKICHEYMVADALATHHAEACAFRIVECLMCSETMQARHRERHDAESCPFRVEKCVACGMLHMHNRKSLDCQETVVRCMHGCGREMRRKWIREHEIKACPKRKIACKWNCGANVCADVYVHHVENECAARVVACDWTCGIEVAFRDLETHKITRCKRRFVWCPSGCGMKIQACDAKVHMRDECSHREQICRVGCGRRFHARDVDDHELKQCPFRLVACGDGCGEQVQAQHLTHHKETACSRRLVRCELGCDMDLPFDELDDHHRCVKSDEGTVGAGLDTRGMAVRATPSLVCCCGDTHECTHTHARTHVYAHARPHARMLTRVCLCRAVPRVVGGKFSVRWVADRRSSPSTCTATPRTTARCALSHAS